ncbi:MAG: glycosyltransferase [Elusimicrobia bacterium]|nr:glycosyltransferase [Elusimicrobiota bacterium]
MSCDIFVNRHILLMYISRVSGHRQASVAISKSIKRILPDAEVKSVNGFGHTFPVLEALINAWYMAVIRHAPQIWDRMYDNPKVVQRSARLRRFLNRSSHDKMDRLFAEFPADTVVCSQAFPCGMVADYKVARKKDIKVIGVLTDWAPHSYWIHEGVDIYVVPSEDTRERFIKKGVSPEKIRVLGIPIRYHFAEPVDRRAVQKDLGLDPAVATILVMGGGQGLGRMREAVTTLLRERLDLQIIVVCGSNQKLYRWLTGVQKTASQKLVVYDYASNIHELMTVSDLIVTKPGGMTTSECLAKGLPMVILDPLPGQEARNTDFLLEHGIAVHAHDIEDLAEEVDLLLRSPEKLAAMRSAAFAQGKPRAADDIATLVQGISR